MNDRFEYRHGLRLLVSSLILLVVAAATTAAQNPDRKLSVDPYQMVLSDDARVEAATAIGSRTLAVWGSSRVGAGDLAHNVLYMQMFEGRTPLGDPRPLTSPDAEPSGFLQVMSVGESFIVAWNDRRSGERLSYMMRVALDGTSGTEERIGTGAFVSPGMIAASFDGGYLLLWSDSSTTTAIRERRIDARGTPLSAERMLDSGSVLGIKRIAGLDGTLLLERGDPPPLLLDAAGDIHTIDGAAAAKFTHPYYLDDDGSVLSITNGRLRVWASLLDTVPVRSVVIPAGEAFVPSMIPSRDSLGQVQIYFAVPFGVSYGGGFGGGNTGFNIYRMTEASPALFSAGEWVAGRLVYEYGHRYIVRSALNGVAMQRGCSNQYELVIQLQTSWTYEYREVRDQGSGVTPVRIAVDRYGPIPGDRMTTGCGMAAPVWIRRPISKRASEVDLLVGDTLWRLSAPVAILPVNVPDTVPAILALGGRFLFASHRQGIDSMMMLASWETDGGLRMIDSLDVDLGAGSPEGKEGMRNGERLLRGTGAFLVDRRDRWRERKNPTQTADSQHCTIYLPTEKGWRQGYRKGSSFENSAFGAFTVVFDEASSQFVVAGAIAQDFAPYRHLRLDGFDTDGLRRWSVDSVPVGLFEWNLGVVPVAPSNYSVVTLSHMARFENDTLIRAVEIGFSTSARHLPLPGGRVLRWYRVWPAREIGLDLFDSNGTRLLGSTAMLPDNAYDPMMLFNPLNGGFVVITGSPAGVQAISIDESLRTIRGSHRVSQTTAPIFHPTAAIAGDRLNVVWTDWRNGVSDIYGTSIDLGIISGVGDDRREKEGTGIRIHPNPASNLITTTWKTPAPAGAYLELIDLMGRVVVMHEIETGAYGVQIPTASLSNGLYVVRLMQAGHATTGTIHVSR